MKDKILLVDDEKEFTEALAKRLKARGFIVECVASGEEALERAAVENFTTIVLDLKMPGMDGLETLERLLEINPDHQIILLTGHGSISAGVDAMKAGAVDFVEKPAEFSELFEKIKAASSHRMTLIEKHDQDALADILGKKGW